MDINTYGGLPGIGAQVTSQEAQVWAGRETDQSFGTVILDSTAVDAGNTPTSALRPGLVLGKLSASNRYVAYSATATNGAEIAVCVLTAGLSMLDQTGTASNKEGHVLAKGILKASALLGLDAQARRQLVKSGRFVFDDDPASVSASFGAPVHEVAKTTDYTVVAADNGTQFTNNGAAGAVNFTLPTLAPGLVFEFLALVAQNVTVTSAAGGDIVWDNSIARSSLAFSTASHIIGGHLRFQANAAGTKWYVQNISPATNPVTAA